MNTQRMQSAMDGATGSHAALLQEYQERASSVVEIDALSVMKQDDGAARFRVIRRCRLRGRFR